MVVTLQRDLFVKCLLWDLVVFFFEMLTPTGPSAGQDPKFDKNMVFWVWPPPSSSGIPTKHEIILEVTSQHRKGPHPKHICSNGFLNHQLKDLVFLAFF